MGQEQGERVEPPQNESKEKKKSFVSNEYRKYQEAVLGGGNHNKGLKKFLKYNGTILKFKIRSEEGEIMILKFFMENSQIEVKRVVNPESCDKIHGIFIKKMKIPCEEQSENIPGLQKKYNKFL